MPRGDKTGPQGLGSKTGREAGYCAGYSVPGYMNPTNSYGRGLGRGRGGGRGRGFGRGRFLYQPLPFQPVYQHEVQQRLPREEIAVLENYQIGLEAQKSNVEQEITRVKTRIEELQAKINQEKTSNQNP
jgi:hypothetical protein